MNIFKKFCNKFNTISNSSILEWEQFKTVSYSQEGEDLILLRYFGNKESGVFVDIGSHHPFRFSNTFSLYQRGWSGINVDANPGTKELFDKFRPRDTNVEIGISNKETDLEYFNFKESALNTFSTELANTYINGGWELKSKLIIRTIPLIQLFEKYMSQASSIDFLTMDIEGLELEALQSNDWLKFRPKLLLVEILNFEIEQFQTQPIFVFLKSKGYSLTAKTKNTVFFEDNLSK
jgi:hypothetical protein